MMSPHKNDHKYVIYTTLVSVFMQWLEQRDYLKNIWHIYLCIKISFESPILFWVLRLSSNKYMKCNKNYISVWQWKVPCKKKNLPFR